MERYCIESFRNLTFGNSEICIDRFTQVLEDYKKECHYVYTIGLDQNEWKRFGFTQEEKISILNEYVQPDKAWTRGDSWTKLLMEKEELEDREKFISNVLNRDIRENLMNMINSNAAWYGIVSDMYLARCKLFSAETTVGEGLNDEEKEKVNLNFKNKKAGKNDGLIIPMKQIPGTINKKVAGFGIDVIRLWGYSKAFRNIFGRVSGSSSKYRLCEFFKCFVMGEEIVKVRGSENEQVKQKRIVNTEENNLILDKMVGGSILNAFLEYIYPFVEGIDAGEINELLMKFVEQVLVCKSNDICCDIFRIIGGELRLLENVKKEYTIKMIGLYIDYLQEIIPMINDQYKMFCDIIAAEIDGKWSREAFEHYVEVMENQRECQDMYRIEYARIDEYLGKYGESQTINNVIAIVTEKSHQRYR